MLIGYARISKADGSQSLDLQRGCSAPGRRQRRRDLRGPSVRIFLHIVARHWETVGITFRRRRYSFLLPGPKKIPHILGYVCRPMIERLHHLAFVERPPVPGRTRETITIDGISALLFLKLLARAEQVSERRTGRRIFQRSQ